MPSTSHGCLAIPIFKETHKLSEFQNGSEWYCCIMSNPLFWSETTYSQVFLFKIKIKMTTWIGTSILTTSRIASPAALKNIHSIVPGCWDDAAGPSSRPAMAYWPHLASSCIFPQGRTIVPKCIGCQYQLILRFIMLECVDFGKIMNINLHFKQASKNNQLLVLF